jgi:hypothetical protein
MRGIDSGGEYSKKISYLKASRRLIQNNKDHLLDTSLMRRKLISFEFPPIGCI